jgi:general secretion pathway protein G
MLSRRKARGGFTLIELLLVVVIIGILAALVVPRLVGRSEDARIAKAKGDLATFRNQLAAYDVDNGRFPTSEQGLMALIVAPNTAPEPRNWKGPYIDVSELPLDPWGLPYAYMNPGEMNPNGYDLYSLGPDGENGTEDDIFKP